MQQIPPGAWVPVCERVSFECDMVSHIDYVNGRHLLVCMRPYLIVSIEYFPK